MYGIVNKAIQGLITEKFGEDTWKKIKKRSGVEDTVFLSNESYPDDMTYRMVGAASEVLNIPATDVLIVFGEYWILKTGMDHYGSLLRSGGDNLKNFLINLPNFHSRVMLIYPKLTPPEFKISDVGDQSLHLHYYSSRSGLGYFVYGLIQGIGKLFKTNTRIQIITDKSKDDHEVFLVEW